MYKNERDINSFDIESYTTKVYIWLCLNDFFVEEISLEFFSFSLSLFSFQRIWVITNAQKKSFSLILF